MTDQFAIRQYTISISTGFDADGELAYQCEYSTTGEEPDTMPPWLIGLGMIEALRCDYIAQQTALEEQE